MGIQHFEDLSIGDLKQLINHCDEIVATEKLDGAAVAVGFDDDGQLFMSRESKGGDRYYSSDDWNHRLFWTVGFRSVHKALEQIQQQLKEIIGYPSLLQCEILFGQQPNAIAYNCENNVLVIFGGITHKQRREVMRLLSSKKIPVTLKDVPISTDGLSIDNVEKTHIWSVTCLYPIANRKVKSAFQHKMVSQTLAQIEHMLSQKCPDVNIPNHQLLHIKFNCTPDFIDANKWKEHKQSIRLSKLKLENQLLELKKKIKEHLLDLLVRNMYSQFGNVKGIEGIVLTQGGITVKLVDKDTFTAINRFNHEYREILNVDVWKPLKKQLLTVNNQREAIGFIEKAQTSMKNLLAQYHKEFKNKRIVAQQGSAVRNFGINNAVHERNLQAFAQIRVRLDRLMSVIQHQETYNGEQALLSENLNIIKESGHAFGNTDRIPRELIVPTLAWISKNINIPLEVLKNNLLGSAGKTKTSGDLDIAIDQRMYSHTDLLEMLKKLLGESNVLYSTGLNIVHARIPISGNPSIGHVQVDFMLTDCVEWCKFNFHSDGDASAYKGAYRTRLLSAIAASSNDCEYEDGELVSRKGWVWVPSLGLQWQWRQRPLKKNGTGRVKSFQIMQRGRTINNPKTVARILFGEDVPVQQLGSVENIMPLVKRCFDRERQHLIDQIFGTALQECQMEHKEIFNG